ncbi:MAG: hypothetical protein EKK37_15995 [Sphingobacteriales bacterium]|nr:MAG: hypothetical protein EKK37_15995 [Sphingobacteriales bacterium]
MQIKMFLLPIALFLFMETRAGYDGDKSFEEKTDEATLIFSGKLIFFTESNNIPDSLLLIATDVWKGRYFPGDTIFIYNDLNNCGIMNVKENEEYLIYARSNIIMACSGSKPIWSTTETDELDYKFKRQQQIPTVLLNGERFTKREAERVKMIFFMSDLVIPDSLKPTDPVIRFRESNISLKMLSEMNFDEPVQLIRQEADKKEFFILQYQNTTEKKKPFNFFRRKKTKNK